MIIASFLICHMIYVHTYIYILKTTCGEDSVLVVYN